MSILLSKKYLIFSSIKFRLILFDFINFFEICLHIKNDLFWQPGNNFSNNN